MPLSEDQKAMLRLLAQREQGYEDIAALMGLSVAEVRARAREAVGQLEAEGIPPPQLPPDPVPAAEPEPQAPVEATPAPVEPEPAPPAPPAAEKAPEPAKPAPVQVARQAAKSAGPSRPGISMPAGRGIRAAIAGGIGVLALIVVVLIVSGGGSSSDSTTAASTTPSGSESSEASEEAALTTLENNPKLTKAILAPVGGAEGSGIGIFGKVKKSVLLQVQAKELEPSPKGSAYTVWLYKSPKLALRVGSVTVGKSGGIAAQFPIPTELLAYVASGAFSQIDISLTSNADYEAAVAKAKKEKTLPPFTGTSVLRGEITGPAIKTEAKQ
jgi:hypothetical protein